MKDIFPIRKYQGKIREFPKKIVHFFLQRIISCASRRYNFLSEGRDHVLNVIRISVKFYSYVIESYVGKKYFSKFL